MKQDKTLFMVTQRWILFSMDNVNEIHRATLSYDSIVNTIITVTCIDKLNKQGGPM